MLLTLLISTEISAQTTHYANQVTITWDTPTEYSNGDPLPLDMVILYDVYIREKGEGQVFIAEIDVPPYTITFPNPNTIYDVGVLAKYALGTGWMYSAILWSVEEGWDVGWFLPTSSPANVRIE